MSEDAGLTPAQHALLLARMRQDGKVQKARPLSPEDVMPVPTARMTALEIRRAKFYAGVMEGAITDPQARGQPRAASNWINRPTFQRMIQQAMGAANVSPERIANKVSALLDAEDRSGHPDNETQLKATRLAHDMLMDSTESAPPEREELAELAADLAELTLDELQRRAVVLNRGAAQHPAGHGAPYGRRRRG